MKVAVITSSYPLKAGQAAGHFVEREVLSLVQQGHRVTVIAPGPRTEQTKGNPNVQRLRAGTAFGPPGALPRLKQDPRRLLGILRFVWGAQKTLRRLGKLDLLVAHWVVPCAWPIALAAERMPRMEVVFHGSDVHLLTRLPRCLTENMLRALEQRGARLRFVSSPLQRELEQYVRRRIERGYVQAAETSVSGAPSRREARLAVGLEPTVCLALLVGRLIPSKRTAYALDVLQSIPDTRIVVLGGGPLREELEAMFPQVQFVGAVSHEECLCWLAAANVLVSASAREGAPLAVREARSLGTPVVCFPVGDCEELARGDVGLWLSD